jgi:hypothetical protein
MIQSHELLATRVGYAAMIRWTRTDILVTSNGVGDGRFLTVLTNYILCVNRLHIVTTDDLR